MDVSELLSIINELKQDFPTIEKVEKREDREILDITLEDFSPTKEKRNYEFIATIFNDKPNRNDFADHYMTDFERVEIFHVAGKYKLGSSDLNATLSYLNLLAIGFLKVQILVTRNEDDGTGSIVCRTVIPITKESTNLKKDILHGIKDMLAMHYQVGFNNAVSKLLDTGLDEETEKSIIEKYKIKIEKLLKPDLTTL